MFDSRIATLWLCGLALVLAHPIPGLAAHEPQSENSTAAKVASAQCQREIAQARQLLEAGSNEQAIALLREVLRQEPKNGDAHLLLGSALALAPARSEALKELEKAVELQPAAALTHFTLGTAQARFGEPEAARQSFERALKLDPHFADAHVSLAMILAQQHELAGASEHLNRAIQIYGNAPTAAQSHYLLAQVLTEQNEPDKALEELARAVALRPDYPEAFMAEGSIQKWQHNDAAAIAAFKKAAALSPESFDAQYELGAAYLRANEASQAVEPLHEAANLKPGDQQTLYHLCTALQKTGKQEEAKACQQELSTKINAGLAMDSSELPATEANNAGVELEKVGKLAGALEKYRAAVKLDPKVTVFRRNMALALCRLGRWDEGITELREVLKQDPDDAQATKALYIALENARAEKSTGAGAGQTFPHPK
jgi:tetratricopeptide (TPR) repeat protein